MGKTRKWHVAVAIEMLPTVKQSCRTEKQTAGWGNRPASAGAYTREGSIPRDQYRGGTARALPQAASCEAENTGASDITSARRRDAPSNVALVSMPSAPWKMSPVTLAPAAS